MTSRPATLTPLMVLLLTAGAHAGTFKAHSVVNSVTLNPTSVLVIVNGTARYEGPWDQNDNNALIQTTHYNTTANGGVGSTGNGSNVQGPFQNGQIIWCTDAQQGCPGRGYIPRRPCSFPPFRYWGRTGVTIYHQFNPEIDTKLSAAFPVPCVDDTPLPCGFQPWGQETVLPVAGGPQLVNALPSHSYSLGRTEERDGFLYLMEEWALLAVDREADEGVRNVEVLAASSTAYGAYRRDSLVSGIEESSHPSSRETYDAMAKGPLVNYFRPGRSILLALDTPVHRHDDRWVPTPVPRFPSVAPGAPGDLGRAVVRADFAEDRSLISLEVLYSDRPLSQEEKAIVEDNLRLEYASEKPHRAVLFAVLSLGERIELERSAVSLPQCCCTGPSAICIPNPPQ